MRNFTIKNLSVNDSKSVISKNEKRLNAFFSKTLKPVWEEEFDAVKLSGGGAYDLQAVIGGSEAVNEFMAGACTSEFLKDRFSLKREATVQDLFDKIPKWAVLSITFSIEADGEVFTRGLDLVKISYETDKALAEGYCSRLSSGYDPI